MMRSLMIGVVFVMAALALPALAAAQQAGRAPAPGGPRLSDPGVVARAVRLEVARAGFLPAAAQDTTVRQPKRRPWERHPVAFWSLVGAGAGLAAALVTVPGSEGSTAGVGYVGYPVLGALTGMGIGLVVAWTR